MLSDFLRKRVSVVTTDGRNLVGVLHSADQLLNLVLTSCVERTAAPFNGREGGEKMEESPLGVMLVRGANVVAVGAIDVHAEAEANPSLWTGRDMPPAQSVPHVMM
ncbi:unnamed protein product [Phytomonas sp. Hart1]|nr:unnamed protein product [Phytomonas sp. Hart1]|eukprot:CCW70969.1 unnamed protein product [Phytomonas sp. isolate Hart1]